MPGKCKTVNARQRRDDLVKEIEQHLEEAQGAVNMVALLLEDDGNPTEAWNSVMEDIVAILVRVQKLPR